MSRAFLPVLIILLAALPTYAQGGPPGLVKPMDLPATPGAKVSDVPDYTSGAKRVEEEGKVQFKSDNVPVHFPVIVADEKGKPVSNLKLDAFQVFEDGVEQKITSFEEVVASDSVLPAASSANGLFSNLPSVALQPRRVTVVVIDQVNTPSLDSAEARSQLVKNLGSNLALDHATALLILTTRGLSTICPLTVDPKQVGQMLSDADSPTSPQPGNAAAPRCESAAIQDFLKTGDPAVSQLSPNRAVELTSQMFLQAGWMLSGIPGKKSLIWITGGFPFALKTPSTLPGGAQSLVYERALAALHDSDTSIYPINIGTLSGQTAAGKRRWLENSTPDMLTNFAAMTGGRAYLDSKDFPGALKDASAPGGSYYLIGYDLNKRDNKPGWRQLTVKVSKPEYHVLARSGFLVSNSVFDPDLSRTSDLDIAADSPVDGTALPISAMFQNISGKGNKRKAEFALVVRGDSVTFGERGKNHFQLDVWAVANRGDKQVAKVAQVVQGGLPPDQLAVVKAHGVGYKNALELPTGDYDIHFIVRDKLSGKIGTLSVPLSIK